MSFEQNLEKIITRYNELGNKLMNPEGLGKDEFVNCSKEYSDLGPVVEKVNHFLQTQRELKDLTEMLQDSNLDDEMKKIAEEELYEIKRSLPDLERNVKIALLPKDKDDEKNAILEVRAGTGGEEAALFASVLFRMYQRYAESKGWRFEILSISDTGLGGFKEASASIAGSGVFARLKFESGVHRVQRVPETESSGRIHTSAATVAVLPEAEDIDIHIEEKDLRIDVFRSSGPGGQSVNTTDSAVRIVHIPTGIVVQQQDEKSQHKNKAKALKILRAKLYEVQREQQESERAAQRKGQVGSGDRSERIRTYNYPQGRVTDHRINLTLYKINEIVNEGELDELIEALVSYDEANKLTESV
ncbi:MAG: peptide chain release factor 1 [Sphingobacteriia bacterium]|nr:peptide chain release factor 1 [Sphingobacteriia bacterium]